LQNVTLSYTRGPGVLSTREAASELGVSERTLRRYISAGLIGFHRLPGGHYRIPAEAITSFWSEHSPPPRRAARRAPLVARPRRARTAGQAGVGGRRARLSASTQPRPDEALPARRSGAIAADGAGR
jgi:excisionase family DNA binding protein